MFTPSAVASSRWNIVVGLAIVLVIVFLFNQVTTIKNAHADRPGDATVATPALSPVVIAPPVTEPHVAPTGGASPSSQCTSATRSLAVSQAASLAAYFGIGADDSRYKIRNMHSKIDGTAVVVDVGGNIGRDTAVFVTHNKPKLVAVYEILPSLVHDLRQKFSADKNVRIVPYGLGKTDAKISIQTGGPGDEAAAVSDQITGSPGEITGEIRDAGKEMASLRSEIGPNALMYMHMNCEGCEYLVLERLLDTGDICALDGLEVQFHIQTMNINVPNAAERQAKIESGLMSYGFRPAMDFPFVWQIWIRR